MRWRYTDGQPTCAERRHLNSLRKLLLHSSLYLLFPIIVQLAIFPLEICAASGCAPQVGYHRMQHMQSKIEISDRDALVVAMGQ